MIYKHSKTLSVILLKLTWTKPFLLSFYEHLTLDKVYSLINTNICQYLNIYKKFAHNIYIKNQEKKNKPFTIE